MDATRKPPTDWDRMLEAAKAMPLLDHYQRGRPFNISESNVARWLCERPEVMQFVFNYVRRHQSIVFVEGQWCGAETYASANDQPHCGRVNE